MVLDDNTMCYRHPDRVAAVSCQRCERPICSDCMIQASVGFHCPECARAGAQRVIRARDLSATNQTPATVALLALNVVAFVLQASGLAFGEPPTSLTNLGDLSGEDVADGELWRIVTSAFLHGGLLHIGFNMYALWVFGQALERGLGTWRFALAYLAGLLGGSTAVLAFSFDVDTVGASGAVLGLAGALAAALWARGVPLTQTSLFGLFVVNLALPILVPIISFWGHLGGILGGFAAGWLLTWLPERFGQPNNLAVGATAALCGVLGVAAVAVAAVGGF